MEQWITEDIEAYKVICEKHGKLEMAIGHCALSMIKILNGLSEMSFTQFHKYEKEMLWSAIELFSDQCVEQMKIAIFCKDVMEKKEIISDMETSIYKMMEVCKNIFSGTSNEGRQIFQSLSVDANLYELSPKLCAFYSLLLEKTVALFEEEKKYAFVIHPSLRSTIEAKILLNTRMESGRVVIIYISESLIERFNVVPICLIHEAFHVITKERNRKNRAKCFILHMLLYVEQCLFSGVDFFEDQQKENLMKEWFNRIEELADKLKSRSEESRQFYSKSIVKEVGTFVQKKVISIRESVEKSVMGFLYNGYVSEKYGAFRDDIVKAKKNIEIIQNNVNEMIINNGIWVIADMLMSMYQECYADIACILTLELSVSQYSSAFGKTIQFNYDDTKYYDTERIVREYLVTKAVANVLTGLAKKEWKEHLESMETQLQKLQDDDKEISGQNGGIYGKIKEISLTRYVRECFDEYLFGCAMSFSAHLERLNGVDQFRTITKKCIDNVESNILIEVLSQNLFDSNP